MPEKPGSVPGGTEEWESLSRSQSRREMQAEGEWVLVSHKGTISFGVESTTAMDDCAEMRGIPTAQSYMVDVRVNKKKQQIGIFPVKEATKTSTTIRRYANKGSAHISILLSGVFREHPSLAPTSKVRCIIGRDTAPDGLPMVTVAPLSGTTHVTGTRSTSTAQGKKAPSPSKETAAGENQEPDED